jgi:hypothetical protein
MTLDNIVPKIATFSRDFGAALQKLQFEMFGTFTDFSLTDMTEAEIVGIGPTGEPGPEGGTGAAGSVGATGAAGATGATGQDSGLIRYTQSFSSASTLWNVTHNLNSTDVTWALYDTNDVALIPSSVDTTDPNTMVVTFGVARAGRVVVIA